MQPSVIQRPHPTYVDMSQLVLQKDGLDIPILNVSAFSRLQAKDMRDDLDRTKFTYTARYCNGGLTRDLHELIRRIQNKEVKLHPLTKIEDDGRFFTFWGGIAGVTQDFCFLIFDEGLAYQVMLVSGLEPEKVLKAFMARRKFTILPEIKANRLRHVSALANDEQVVLPPFFEKQEDGTFLSLIVRTRVIITDGLLELRRQVLPQGEPV
ncbi:hypothetical protein HA052_04400 [Chromobacterium haemolyticum]|uniref:Uncharacterized protein n=1 Tax=Chromobacterium fluminis TaxID=3044269 RepID=A0ABX0L4F0_9NEIS|nr:hypothetical protein [Chromobacterium haemolyticum]NHR04431.1 hypothetical protein [Chromobacterium haemolyticum]